MIKRIQRVIFILLINTTFYSFQTTAQDFTFSNILSATNSMNIVNIEKVSDGFLVFGDYRGILSVPENYIADGYDIYLIKYNDNFEIQWSEKIGGTLIDYAYDLKVANDGSIYFIGTFSGTCLFEEANQITSDGLTDVLLAKYSSTGSFVWGKKVAFNLATQYGTCIDIDNNGDLIIGGYYKDSITFDNDRFVSPFGIYYAKYNNTGDFQWAKNIPSTATETQMQSVSAFNDGYYFNGNMKGTTSFDLGDEVSNSGSFTDVFLYKTDFSGNGLWVRRTYGDGNALTGTITSDEYGSIYYTGYYAGTQLEVDQNESVKSSTILNNSGSLDVFVIKYNKEGNLIWTEDYGQSGEDFARDINFQNDFLYITGYFSDTLIFGSDTLLSGSSLDIDAFLGMIDNGGNTLKAIKIMDSGESSEIGMKLSSDINNNAYWGGNFKSNSITIGDSVYSNPNIGKRSVFVAKYKPPYVAAFTKKTNVSCNKGSDGELIVTPYFGVLPYTYSWSHDAELNDSTATGLTAGTYTVTVTDALDSIAIAQYTITEPDSFIFNPAITQVTTCSYSAEGAINLNVTGGNGGNSYYWFEDEGGSGVQLTFEDQFNLTKGEYSVSVTDYKGCTADTTMYITGPEPITFGNSNVTDYTSPLIKGEIDLEFVGGFGDPASFTFDWTGPSAFSANTEDIFDLDPGNYTVTISDVHSCDFDTTFNVKDLDTFYVYISDYKNACNGTINGHATASYYSPDNHTNITYQWDANADNQTTAKATNLAPGMYYYVTVTDLDNTPNIVMVDSIYIEELTYTFNGSISGSSTTTLDCYGDANGFIDLNITSAGILPYTYLWNNGSTFQDIIDLPIGTYSVTATDANECQFSITNYVINQPPVLAASAEIVNKPSCYGNYDGEITVVSNGGTAPYTYQWNDPGYQTGQNADGLDAGFYAVIVTDYNGCTKSASVNLTQPNPINVIKTVYPVSCNAGNDGTALLTVTGGTVAGSYIYNWSTTNGSGLVTGIEDQTTLTAGNYNFTIIDDNACTYEDSIEVTEPEMLVISNESKTDVSTCFGDANGTITIAASGGTGALTYTLNPGAIQTNNTGSFSGLLAGTYSVDVDDANGCGPITSNSIIITEPSVISIEETSINHILCNGANDGSIDITVTGGTVATTYTYEWSTSDGSGLVIDAEDQTDLSAGTYDLTVTDDNSCTATTSITLNEPTAINIDETNISNVSCFGLSDGAIDITVTGGTVTTTYTYEWSTSDGSGLVADAEDQSLLSVGTYDLTVTDDNNCTANTSIIISQPDEIVIDSTRIIDATAETANDGSIRIYVKGGAGTYNFTLNPNATQANQTGIFTNLLPGDYTIDILDTEGCGPITSEVLTISFPEGINNIDLNNKIKIYPNPTSSSITVEIENIQTDSYTISIFDITGKQVYSEKVKNEGLIKKELDLSGYSKGIYSVNITFANKIWSQKIVLQ
ncbi:MAG: T9SS type A sorting domain-containing protein [Bacteroidales bacterium]